MLQNRGLLSYAKVLIIKLISFDITLFILNFAWILAYMTMEQNRPLYPIKFIALPSRRPWGGSALIDTLGKSFVEVDESGNETALTIADRIGESWELADMGAQDSVVENGWLAGNTISELMETYLDRIVGEDVFDYYGTQFPLLIKFLDINDKLSVQVHPDDEVAQERYDSLGKAEIWYVMDAKPGACVYMGFNRDVTPQELYDRCHNGTVEEILNVIYPKKGDSILITPGTVHAADGGLLIAEIQESSDMTFRLYDWGREFNPATARKMHLDEAMDVIDYKKYDPQMYRKGPLWGGEACPENEVGTVLAKRPEFTATKIKVDAPLKVSTETFGSFVVYVCPEGEASIQVPAEGDKMDSYQIKKGDTYLIPADMPDFFIVPRQKGTILIEGMIEKREIKDSYVK